MIEAEDTLALVSALEGPAPTTRLESLLERPELSLMFPAVGIPTDRGTELLEATRNSERRANLDEVGRMVVSYFDTLVQERASFERLVQDLRKNEPALLRAAFARTRQYLPERCLLGEVRLVFLPVGYDFRTDRETVYLDPLAALQYGLEGIEITLSHELHHIARYRLTRENLTLMRSNEREGPRRLPDVFREWATWLEAEGIADCVSNVTDTDIPALHPAVEQRRQQMVEYQRLLGDALVQFQTAMGGAGVHRPVSDELRTGLMTTVHPIGARMAATILKGKGRAELVECVGHPGVFLRRYNEVSKDQSLVLVDPGLLNALGWA